jgi:hypothetical protein
VPTDPLTASRYPASSDAPNVNQHIQNAVMDLSDNTIPRFSSTATRDTAYSAWVAAGNTMVAGLFCWVTGTGLMEYSGTAWAVFAPSPTTLGGASSPTTDASGNFTQAHSLGRVPNSVVVVSRTTGSFGGHVFAVTAATSTNFTARVYYNNAAMASATLGIYFTVTG